MSDIIFETTEVDHELPEDTVEGLLKQRFGTKRDDVYFVGRNPVTENLQFVNGRCKLCGEVTKTGASWSMQGVTVSPVCYNHTDVPSYDPEWKLPQDEQFYPLQGANIEVAVALLTPTKTQLREEQSNE